MNADHVGRECTETVLGQSWTFSRSTRAIHQAFSEWARTVLPNPVESVLRNLTELALRDAEILRQLQVSDQAELKRAEAENRNPCLMAPQYRPFADTMTRQAVDKAACYLGFGSPEVTSVLRSTEGMSYMFFLLLKDAHPDVTPAKAMDIMIALGDVRAAHVMATVQGKSEDAPKNAPAPAA